MPFYTDGSGINNKIGASAYLLSLDQTCKLYLDTQGYYTVYNGELTRILMALWTTKDFFRSNQRLYIFTENKAAVQSIGDPHTRRSGQNILNDIILAIDAVRSRGKSVDIHWISAHCGIGWNGRADISAKEVTGWRIKRKESTEMKKSI